MKKLWVLSGIAFLLSNCAPQEHGGQNLENSYVIKEKYQYMRIKGPDFGQGFTIVTGEQPLLAGVFPDMTLPLDVCKENSKFICAFSEFGGLVFVVPKVEPSVGAMWDYQGYDFELKRKRWQRIAGMDTVVSFVDVKNQGKRGVRFAYSYQTGLWAYIVFCDEPIVRMRNRGNSCSDQIYIATGIGYGKTVDEFPVPAKIGSPELWEKIAN
ncbi:MAG: hypothetical protein EP340_00785 [Alphaproteobacteria bacterium]|nr:MAG: hypothetical protein EP340_00785 [Alphaproteobacteria bacterium]